MMGHGQIKLGASLTYTDITGASLQKWGIFQLPVPMAINHLILTIIRLLQAILTLEFFNLLLVSDKPYKCQKVNKKSRHECLYPPHK